MDSAGSTQQAIAAVLGSLKPTNFESEHIFDGFVGVDAEWQASILGILSILQYFMLGYHLFFFSSF